jgi:hypothetical protein
MVVDRRNDRVGIIVEQRDGLRRGRVIGDPGEAAQVAVPQHRVDPLGGAPADASGEHPPAGIAAEIGLGQRPRDPSQRGAFDR